MTKKEVEAINRLIELRVNKEVDERLSAMHMEILAEVAGIIQYSERKILSEIQNERVLPTNGTGQSQHSQTPVKSDRDFDRVMGNLKSMQGFDHITEKVEMPKNRYTHDGMVNDILNETSPFNGNEMRSAGTSLSELIGGSSNSVGNYEEPWDNSITTKIPENVTYNQSQTVRTNTNIPQTIIGIDNKPINTSNPAVQKVLDILARTDHAKKFKEIEQAGNEFRDGGASAPKFNSEYFDKQVVD